MITLKIKNVSKTKLELPKYARPGDSGMDLRADIDEPVILKPLERKLISAGIIIELPDDYEAQVRPRSGLALKKGVTVLNTPGTIDASYRGVIGVILVNLSNEEVTINPGNRIAQLVIARVEKARLVKVDVIMEDTTRGSGGFGSSGVN
jgi:dUTP diphosphatase